MVELKGGGSAVEEGGWSPQGGGPINVLHKEVSYEIGEINSRNMFEKGVKRRKRGRTKW